MHGPQSHPALHWHFLTKFLLGENTSYSEHGTGYFNVFAISIAFFSGESKKILILFVPSLMTDVTSNLCLENSS